MEAPLVSCVVPVFDAEAHLGDALESILAQSHRPVEVIAVDDGSTDGSLDVIARFAPRVRCVRRPNGGEAAARNTGVAAASGAFVAFLDADDLWEPGKLATQLARLAERPDIDLCFTRFQNFWAPELADEARRYEIGRMADPCAAWCIGTLLARRTVFERFGPFDETLRGSVNMTWFLEAATAGARIDVLDEVLMRRRLHPGNLSRRDPPAEWLFPMIRAWRNYQRSTSRQ